jgi:hypothetical protein
VRAAALEADELLFGLETQATVLGLDHRRRRTVIGSSAQEVADEEAGQLGYRKSSLIRRCFQRCCRLAWHEEWKFDHAPAEPAQRRWSAEAPDAVRLRSLAMPRHSLRFVSHRYLPSPLPNVVSSNRFFIAPAAYSA